MSGFVILLVVAVAALLIWQFRVTREALATTRVASTRPPSEVARTVLEAFGGAQAMLWTNGEGPGSINMRRRGKDGGITMSINIEPAPGGGSFVDMWASSYHEYFMLFANFAGSVTSKKKAIARQLAA